MYDIFLICFFILVVGACIGSFLNVVALRAISKESVIFPNSKCPSCNTPIKWYDNIPIFSYFFTVKGKCRSCGCKISIQYPIVEALTSVLFLVVCISFGFTIKSLLILILLSMAIVLSVTDIKEQYTYTVHLWIFVITSIISSLYFHGIKNYMFVILGVLSGIIVMELLARGSFYLIKKKHIISENNDNENCNDKKNEEKNDEDEEDINTYIQKKKRVFGIGDTYIAAGMGALLGWKYIILAVMFAVILQAVCIIPSFLLSLYKGKDYKLCFSLIGFIILSIIYWVLFNIISLSTPVSITFVIILAIIAFYILTALQNKTNMAGFKTIPFGPPLLVSMFIIYFWGETIINFIRNHIWLIAG